MADSSGHGIHGRVPAAAEEQGLTLTGKRYRWSARCPACSPVQNGRVVRVPDRGRLEIHDPNVTYVLAFRFRATTVHLGNLMQKGHSTAPGGQIKVQGPGGRIQCLFRGASGDMVGTESSRRLNDGQWHVVACVHKPDRVVEYVDGGRVDVHRGSTGRINNDKPWTIGGKLHCDQVKITCDYFSGAMDWIRIGHD
jgi:hypothetical protein